MRLVEFLIHLLETHAQTLQRLAALFGEEELMRLLEIAGDHAKTPELKIKPEWIEYPGLHGAGPEPYTEIAGTVRELGLPSMLEFHLWAYPFYRAFIESPLDLNSRIVGPGGEAGIFLIEESLAHAKAWIKTLPISPDLSLQAESAAQIPWLKFRAHILKRIGRRPLGPVY